MTCLAANNASARLATSVTVEDLAIQLSTGEGAMFPTPTAGDYFMITVFEQTGDAFNMEIMKCTHRDGDVLTVARAQEGTSAAAFSVSGRVENRFTAGMYNAMGDEVRAIAQSVQQQLDNKQDTLTFDTTPTAGSSNPVTSDGIRSFVLQAGMQRFTTNGTFVVPDGVTTINVLIQGGGGGGSGNSQGPGTEGPGGGGGAGGAVFMCMEVSPGEQIPVTVGVGGAPGVGGNHGGASGGTSSFGETYATGGAGGHFGTAAGGVGVLSTDVPGIRFTGGSGTYNGGGSGQAGSPGGSSVTAHGSGGAGAPGIRGASGVAGSSGAVFVWW